MGWREMGFRKGLENGTTREALTEDGLVSTRNPPSLCAGNVEPGCLGGKAEIHVFNAMETERGELPEDSKDPGFTGLHGGGVGTGLPGLEREPANETRQPGEACDAAENAWKPT